jgi:hypothetical protein
MNPVLALLLPKLLDVVFDKLREKDVPVTREELRPVVAKALNEAGTDPVVENETNQEPWYKSRVKLGLLLAGVTYILQFFGFELPTEFAQSVVDTVLQGGTLVGIVVALWGRFSTGLKPLFSKK